MEKRQIYLELIAVIRHVLCGEPLPEQLHWERIIPLAAGHNLMGFVYRALGTAPKLSKKLREQVEAAYFAAVGRQERQDYYARELFRIFSEQQIPFLPLQGYCMRELYPQANWRTSQDLDILVPEDKREDVRSIFSGMGFRRESRESGDTYTLDQVCVNIHTAVFPQDIMKGEDETLWESLVSEDGISYRFQPAAFYAYQVSRMRRNFAEGEGIGIRSLLDLYMCRAPLTEEERARVNEWFAQRGILSFAACMEDLSEVWFGDRAPTNDTILLGSYIAAQGNITSTLEVEPAKRAGLFRLIFPSYRMMKREFKAVKRVPILLPLFWVVRWLLLPFRGGKQPEGAIGPEERSQKMLARVRELTGIEPSQDQASDGNPSH